jgi:predicted house-cleaning noncanonical NTP pyrophosphatase (MazG superfamily)
MGVKIYNKLVRDKIPEIIEADNRKYDIKILSDEEYLTAIDAKLDEEVAEYHKDQNIEELADILEVVYAAAVARGYSIEQLEEVRQNKAETRGRFDKRLYLKSVISEELKLEDLKYFDVVKKAKMEVASRGIYGDIRLADCKEWQDGNVINLWSYWQGYQIEDIDEGIDILLVGQDWGNPKSNPKIIDIIHRIQAGEKTAHYTSCITSATDRNLIELFKILGCDITKENPGKRLLFTNYCLAYRTGSETGGMTKSLLRMDAEIFDKLVNAVRPKTIICLGKITYEAVTESIANEFVKNLKEGKPIEGVYPKKDSIKVFGVAHCGARGVINVGGKEIMNASWQKIAEYLTSEDN